MHVVEMKDQEEATLYQSHRLNTAACFSEIIYVIKRRNAIKFRHNKVQKKH